MKYGIFSDIHGNWEAFEAVQDLFLEERVEKYICGGDVVGYGANPKECMERVLELDCMWVGGNHDYAVAGKLSMDYFNKNAQIAVFWARERLPKKYLQHLANLDLVQKWNDSITLVHSTLSFPELFDYIQRDYDADLSLDVLDTPVCFYGHSHVPVAFTQNGAIAFSENDQVDVFPNEKILINVGSVGQPRDHNPLASCCIYDDEIGRVWIYRIEYDVDKASDKIIKAGLPEVLASRLYYGR